MKKKLQKKEHKRCPLFKEDQLNELPFDFQYISFHLGINAHIRRQRYFTLKERKTNLPYFQIELYENFGFYKPISTI